MNMYLFAREGKDRYIDFLKGISIISVVFLHNVPFSLGYYIGFPFTLSQAVPIFLLVQVVNTYRSYLNHNQNLNIYFCWRNIKKNVEKDCIAIYMYDRNTIIIDFNYFTKEYK